MIRYISCVTSDQNNGAGAILGFVGCETAFQTAWRVANLLQLLEVHTKVIGPDSSDGMATCYGFDGPGFESQWGGEILHICPDRPWGPPSLL